jgi:hypothetical protein
MGNIDEKEIQKTLDEINKRVAESQSGKIYSSSSFSPSSNLKLVLTILGVMLALFASAVFYIKSNSQKVQMKIPPGYEIIYSKDAPPRLQPKL